MKVLHVSAECYPIAKIGGLADVVGALPKYQKNQGVESSVIMPFYDNKFTNSYHFESIYDSELLLGGISHSFSVLKLQDTDVLDIDMFFIDVPDLLYKDFVYSFDDTDRFLAFQIAFLDWLLTLNKQPSIIHCHDHHTGLVPFMLQESLKYKNLKDIPVVLTIHNAQYQGWFSHDKVGYIPPFDFEKVGLLDWGGVINPLAAGIKCAWAVTTVSPSYMEELQHAANGLESLLSEEKDKCVGILNGIDDEVWNPETDEFIVKNYSARNVHVGRQENKDWLCKEFGLDNEKPLFAFIGRLVGEKGADLLPQAIEIGLESNDINVLVLGSGHKEIEEQLDNLKNKYAGSYNAFIGYDEKLSHIIYAGADFLLMPSRVEPCGLNQLYALRYGTVPIVRRVGGLKDTVIDIGDGGFGICHNETSVHDIVFSIERATQFYKKTTAFKKVKKVMMDIDHSWNASAKQYLKLYKSLN